MAVEQVKLVLIGVGNIGRRFLELLARKEDTLRARYGLELVLVGVADTSGAALAVEGTSSSSSAEFTLSAVEVLRTGSVEPSETFAQQRSYKASKGGKENGCWNQNAGRENLLVPSS